ncbi:MAG: Gfo/Idh/MocA family oxidoreductase [Candidatus Thermoplasmatota archaeon]|nr:Gfo/Idh/MocA family oxidoreductase [Candidatus Thermoplasmatota archaeon]
MKFLVVGCGSIGERHVRNLQSLHAGTLLACDTDRARLDHMQQHYLLETFTDVDEALSQQPDAVLICTPPSSHIPLGRKALRHHAHIFMEKPLSHTLTNVDCFLKEAAQKKRLVLVGYNLRFHPGIQRMKQLLDEKVLGKVLSARAEMGQYLPEWRPSQDYRKSYTARHALGGGIILDASHEIDYMSWLFSEITQIFCFADHLSTLQVDVEDTAEILLRFHNNVIADIHLDFVQRQYARNCKIVGEKGTLLWDYPGGCVKLYRAETQRWTTWSMTIDPNQMYVAEMKHFISCLKGKTPPLIDGLTAKKVLEVALAAKHSARTGKMIRL